MQAIKCFIQILIFVCLLSTPMAYAEDNIFTVDNMLMSKTSSSSTKARRLAVSEVEGLAFDKLMRSLITDEDYYNLPILSKGEVSALVKGFEVDKEKITGKKYEALFSVSFFPEKVKKLLASNEIKFIENKGAPTLILPIYQEGNNIVLWEKDNPWWNAWEKVASESNVMPMVLPLGDIDDMNIFNVEDAFSVDGNSLKKLADKYDAKDVLIVEAQYSSENFDGKASLDVVIRLTNKGNKKPRRQAQYDDGYSDSKQYLLDSAVNDLVKKLENDWLNESSQIITNSKSLDEEKNVVVTIPIDGLRDWLRLKKKIEKISAIKKMVVMELTAGTANVKLFYKDDFATFSYFLSVDGLNMKKEEESDSWYLETS